jgi:threonylcarbamoyladenosine tRNA methylthiotransferase MtaB
LFVGEIFCFCGIIILVMKVHVTTLGCRLNQSESDRIAREFAMLGHDVVMDAAQAELQIINTCAVTHKATRESRQLARYAHRAAPHALTVITGCASEIEPEFFADVDGVACVTGHKEKEQLIPLLLERGLLSPPDAQVSEAFPLPHTRTRAFVKIQDGCGNACAYCVSRLARGEERSRPIAAIVREVNMLVAEGFHEIVLTGLHAASYGRDLNANLAALVRALLAQTTIPRIRLSSLEPWGASDELLDLWGDARLCRHLHLPLQAGCDATLRRMRRGYNTRQYAARIESARKRIPNIGISTDIIVGFPNESEQEFEASLRFVAQMQFSQAHVFPFSPRAGTEAATMRGQASERVKQARSEAMRQVTAATARCFRETLIGQTFKVLWEQQAQGYWTGFTDNYVRVFCASADDWHNRITPTRIVGFGGDGMSGELLSEMS